MKRIRHSLPIIVAITMAGSVFASEASTSASANSRREATATASYEGDRGVAKTETRTGKVNIARGVAVAVDKKGMTISFSQAAATKRGPAIATTINIAIGRDGKNSVSGGTVISVGGKNRSASTSGVASTRHYRANTSAAASGETRRGGRVVAVTRSAHSKKAVKPMKLIKRLIKRR